MPCGSRQGIPTPWVQAMWPFRLAVSMASHDLLFAHLHYLHGLLSRQAPVFFDQLHDSRHGHRVPDHGRLGHTGTNDDGTILSLSGLRFMVIQIHRVGMFRLDPENHRQGRNDFQIEELEKSLHGGRYVACVSDGHEHGQIADIVVEGLRNFIAVGFLAEDAPGILGNSSGQPRNVRKGIRPLSCSHRKHQEFR